MEKCNPAYASCKCGAVKIKMHGSLARMFCHCTICQRLNKAPYGDPVFFWRWQVEVNDPSQLAWKRHRWLPIHANRGTCKTCDTLIYETIAATPLAVVIATTWDEPKQFPPSSGHIFYGTRVADVEDNLPKKTGYFTSELSVLWWVLKGLFKRS